MDFVVRKILLNALSQYVETDFNLVLNLFSSGNTAILENVRLKKTAIPSSFPVKVVQGILGRVVVSLSLFQLSSKPVRIYIEDVSVVLDIKEDNDVSREDLILRLHSEKETLRKSIEASIIKTFEDHILDDENILDNSEDEGVSSDEGKSEETKPTSSGFKLPSLPSFLKQLVRMVKVHIGNIHIRLEQRIGAEDGLQRCNAIGLCLQSIDIDNTTDNWLPGISESQDILFKSININRLGCYVDSNAPLAKCVPFSETVNGVTKQIPSQLVSYVPHTWLLEPVSISVRLAIKNYWPKPSEKIFQPILSLKVFISTIKLNVHGIFVKTLNSMKTEYERWKETVNLKVAKMDSFNAKDTMSREEHTERCQHYKDLYIDYVDRVIFGSVRAKASRKMRSRLKHAENSIHLSDLFLIWCQVLSAAEARERRVHTDTSINSRHGREQGNSRWSLESRKSEKSIAVVSKGLGRLQKNHFREEDSRSHAASSLSSAASANRENFMHLLSRAQIVTPEKTTPLSVSVGHGDEQDTDIESPDEEKNKNNTTSQDDLPPGEIEIDPKVEVDMFLDGVHGHVSLSRYSENMLLLELQHIALGIKEVHLEELKTRNIVSFPDFAPRCASHAGFSSTLVVHILEARGLTSGSHYVKVRFEEGEKRTSKFSSKNPVWNESLSFESTDAVLPPMSLIYFEVWTSPDIGRDRPIGRFTFKALTKLLTCGSLHSAWLKLELDGVKTQGSLLVQFSAHYPILPSLERRDKVISKSLLTWQKNSARSTWVDIGLGKLIVKTVTNCEFNGTVAGFSSLRSKSTASHPIDLLRIDDYTYILLAVDIPRVLSCFHQPSENKLSGGVRSPRSSALPPPPPLPNSSMHRTVPIYAGVFLDKVHVLFSRWQIVFLLTRLKEVYAFDTDKKEKPQNDILSSLQMQTSASHIKSESSIPPQLAGTLNSSSRSEGDVTRDSHPPGIEDYMMNLSSFENLLADSKVRSQVLNQLRRSGSDFSDNENKSPVLQPESTIIRPYTVVNGSAVPFALTSEIYVEQVKAAFTWGLGKVSAAREGARAESNDVAVLVATRAAIMISSHSASDGDYDRSNDGIKCMVTVGSIGMMDEANPDRPVLTRRHYRNTNFAVQADDPLPPMLSTTITLPYGWAYNWNIDSRRAVEPPKSLTSVLSLQVRLSEWAIETPALQYTLPGLLGGIMPLTKLIELPPLPCIAFKGLSVEFDLDMSIYLAESINSTFGSRVFFFDIKPSASYMVDSATGTETVDVFIESSFGLCRLSRKSFRSGPSESISSVGSSFMKSEKENEKAQKSLHQFESSTQSLPPMDAEFNYSDNGSLEHSIWKLTHRILTNLQGSMHWKYTSKNSHTGEVVANISIRPFVCYFWIHDMALFFAIFANFFNDFLVLQTQLEAIIQFELPEILRKDNGDTSEKEAGKEEDNEYIPLTRVSGDRFRSLSSESSFRKSGLEKPNAPQLTFYIASQDILQFPFRHPTVKSMKFVVRDTEFAGVLVIGRNDLPVFRIDFATSGIWCDTNIKLALELAMAFFDSGKAGWQPVVEPWRLECTVVFEDLHLGLTGVKLKGAGVLAQDMFDVIVSEEFVKAGVDLLIQGISFVDDTSGRVVTSFYPTIDEDMKHQNEYELWNFTGETIYYQVLDDTPGQNEIDVGSDFLGAESFWDLEQEFSTIVDGDRIELEFPLNEPDTYRASNTFIEDTILPRGACSRDRLIGESWMKGVNAESKERRKKFLRIKFDHYDKSFQAYLIRLDRVGDYALRLGNGNVLRIAIGTRNGLVKKVKLLSSVSIANRTSKEIWLSKEVDSCWRKQPLPVLKTIFAPLSMTDPELKLTYKVNVSTSQDSSVHNEPTSLLSARLDEIPTERSTNVLRVGNFICAMEYYSIELQAMADCIWMDNREQKQMQLSTISTLKPKWSQGLSRKFHSQKFLEKRTQERMFRKRTLRAVQIILKPLFSITNTLPVAVLVQPIYAERDQGNAKYVSSGARFVCEDVNTIAIQLKVPSQDSEWSLPISIKSIAPDDLVGCLDSLSSAGSLDQLLLPVREHIARHSSTVSSGQKEDENRNQEESRENSALSKSKGYVKKLKEATNNALISAEEAFSSDSNSRSNPFERMRFYLPLACRLHPDTILSSFLDCCITVRVISVKETLTANSLASHTRIFDANVHSLYRKVSAVFDSKLSSTFTYKGDIRDSNAWFFFEDTLAFPFDTTTVKKRKMEKNLFLQLIDCRQTSFSQKNEHLIGSGKYDLAVTLLNFFVRKNNVPIRFSPDPVKIFRVDEHGTVLEGEENVLATMDIEIRIMRRNKGNGVENTRMEGDSSFVGMEPDDLDLGEDEFGVPVDRDPPTDNEEFDIFSDWGSSMGIEMVEDSDLSDGSNGVVEEEEVDKRTAQSRWKRAALIVKIKSSPTEVIAPSVEEELRKAHLDINLRDPKILGDEPPMSHDFEDWGDLIERHDRRRGSIRICGELLAKSKDTGFSFVLFAETWFVNESTVPVILQRENSLKQISLFIVDPGRSQLLNNSEGTYLSLKRPKEDLTSKPVNLGQTSASFTMNFKDPLLPTPINSLFATAVKEGEAPFHSTRVIRFFHEIYISNQTRYHLELKPFKRQVGKFFIRPGKRKQPWNFGSLELSVRLREFVESENDNDWFDEQNGGDHLAQIKSTSRTGALPTSPSRPGIDPSKPQQGADSAGRLSYPTTDWSGIIDLANIGWKDSFVSFPLGLYDVDGNPMEIIRVVISRSNESRNTKFVTFMEDNPPTYIVSNESSRKLIFSQKTKDSLESNLYEVVLDPGLKRAFGWAFPSEPRLVLDVQMILNTEDKRRVGAGSVVENIRHSYRLDRVGKMRTKVQHPFEMHCEIQVLGSTRFIRISAEADMGSEDPMSAIRSRRESESYQYEVVCRVLEARNIGVPRGIPAGTPKVKVTCGPNESQETENGELSNQSTDFGSQTNERQALPGRAIGSVRWMHRPLRFGFNVTQPKHIRFELVQPIDSRGKKKSIDDPIGFVQVDLRGKFYDTRDIAKISTGDWVPLTSLLSSGMSNRRTEIRFELYLLSNFSSDALRIPRMLRLKLKGFGLSIVNSGSRREDLYFQLKGIDIGVQFVDHGEVSFTARFDQLQVDSNTLKISQKICIIPVSKDVRFLEIYFNLNQISQNVVSVDTFQVVMQSLVVDVDEKFLDAILRVTEPIINERETLQETLTRAKNTVNGTFSGKRSNTYPLVEDTISGETHVVVENESDPQHNFKQPVHIFFRLQQFHSVDLVRELETIIKTHLKIYIRELVVHPMKITLSFFFKFGEEDFLSQYQNPALKPFKGFLAAFGKWSDVVIRFKAITERDLFQDPLSLAARIGNKYKLMLSKQVWKGIGALEILGNPQHFIERIFAATITFSTLPVVEFREKGVGPGIRATGDAFACLMVTTVAAPLEVTSRVTGSFATLLEGTRAVRHLGLPLVYLTIGLETFQQQVEFFDPLREYYSAIRRPKQFDVNGFYFTKRIEERKGNQLRMDISLPHESINKERSLSDSGFTSSSDNGEEVYVPISPFTKLEEQEVVINVFDQGFIGLTEEALEMNRKSQFHINHRIHICLLLVPGLNLIWIFVYALHCVGILQWF